MAKLRQVSAEASVLLSFLAITRDNEEIRKLKNTGMKTRFYVEVQDIESMQLFVDLCWSLLDTYSRPVGRLSTHKPPKKLKLNACEVFHYWF